MVKEWYRDRSDRLEHREFNSVLGTTAERFRPGRPSHLLGKRRWGRDGTGGADVRAVPRHTCDSAHRYSDAEHLMEFDSGARADGVLRRVLSKSEMTETFQGRADGLRYRHISFLVPGGPSDGPRVPLKVRGGTIGGGGGGEGPSSTPPSPSLSCGGRRWRSVSTGTQSFRSGTTWPGGCFFWMRGRSG